MKMIWITRWPQLLRKEISSFPLSHEIVLSYDDIMQLTKNPTLWLLWMFRRRVHLEIFLAHMKHPKENLLSGRSFRDNDNMFSNASRGAGSTIIHANAERLEESNFRKKMGYWLCTSPLWWKELLHGYFFAQFSDNKEIRYLQLSILSTLVVTKSKSSQDYSENCVNAINLTTHFVKILKQWLLLK